MRSIPLHPLNPFRNKNTTDDLSDYSELIVTSVEYGNDIKWKNIKDYYELILENFGSLDNLS